MISRIFSLPQLKNVNNKYNFIVVYLFFNYCFRLNLSFLIITYLVFSMKNKLRSKSYFELERNQAKNAIYSNNEI